MVREIVVLGDYRLLRPCTPVSFPLSSEADQMVQDLLDTMHHTQGVGLAASQIGGSVRIFTMTTQHTQRKGVPRLGPTVCINPEIVDHAPDFALDFEGCVSMNSEGKPVFRGEVARYTWIVLKWQDQGGGSHQERFEDFLARIVQHEIDHLDGQLFLHRMTSMDDLVMESFYQQHHRLKLI